MYVIKKFIETILISYTILLKYMLTLCESSLKIECAMFTKFGITSIYLYRL
ncbi:hypothetical protein CBE01nite_49240 [Clostridium beijerinckii]|jgi:hypothetical protein|uniref:Uncharacterized protein n=1 Tax=Clostridium beijerinckii TaxID=1520 RepID=A0A1S8QMT7_CLOBE|nr:hypothetical protein [Clostridium beijerinckii]NOV71397.1 hypothetical protein [Clostridium beijerinckii]NOW34324.1 hypothetical protein [Clostridium beijerinckii]NOW83991.1 hypothetical protein [Clostridium beijerinckii]NOW91664.1 hypothetical protein [Clostridium beijerinckii]